MYRVSIIPSHISNITCSRSRIVNAQYAHQPLTPVNARIQKPAITFDLGIVFNHAFLERKIKILERRLESLNIFLFLFFRLCTIPPLDTILET